MLLHMLYCSGIRGMFLCFSVYRTHHFRFFFSACILLVRFVALAPPSDVGFVERTGFSRGELRTVDGSEYR